ncbi:hypothetical protein ACVWXU_002973 [Streptomyces sp. TE33382]
MRRVPAERQVLFHQGREPADRDRRDMERLRLRFGVEAHIRTVRQCGGGGPDQDDGPTTALDESRPPVKHSR